MDFFDFTQTKPDGADLRFSTTHNTPLAYQIEEWDPANGQASVGVRVPKIRVGRRSGVQPPIHLL